MQVQTLIKKAETNYYRRMAKYDWFKRDERPFKTAIRYYPRLNVFKASNCVFNPETLTATSYNWWYFVKKIKGKVVFNDYRYSNSTSNHQSNVRSLLEQLGIKIDLVIKASKGLQDLHAAIEDYENRITVLLSEIQNPLTKAHKNAERKAEVLKIQGKIKAIKKLI